MWWGGFVLLVLIYTGYVSLFNYKLKMPVEFAPAVISCSISMLILIAGFLGVMLPMVYAIGVGGLLSLGYVLLSKRSVSVFRERRGYIVYGLWLIVLGVFIILTQGKLVIHIDNFSHWGRIVKFLLLTDKLPSFHDDIIVYKGYPLSSSVFIYFVCKIIGLTEDCYIFGQSVLLISFLWPLLAFIHRHNILCALIVVTYALFALNVNVSIYDLLVDTLMPLAAVALFGMIFYGFEKKSNLLYLIGMIVPLEVFLIEVKNSGIFFFLACAFYFIMRLKSLKIAKLRRLQVMKSFIGLGIGIPVLFVVFWYCHLNNSFENTVFDSPHVMSIRHYHQILEEKSIADIKVIFFNMVTVLSDFGNVSAVILILVGLLLGISFMCCLGTKGFKNVQKSFSFHAIYMLGIFVFYILGMFLMYIFSMPKAEAVSLACFDRYMLSVDIFILGMMVVLLISQKYGRFYWQPSFIGSLAILIVFLLIHFSIITKNESSCIKREWPAQRYSFHQFIQNNPIHPQKKYLLYMNRNDSVYMYLLMAYELWSTEGSINDFPPFSMLLYYDYLIIWTPDDYSMAYLRDNDLDEYAQYRPVIIPLRGVPIR